MRNKQRYIAAACVTAFCAVAMLGAAVNLERLLLKQPFLFSPARWLAAARASERCMLLWLLLWLLTVLGVIWALWGNEALNIHSKMVELLPGFEVPLPDGQGQHGTAWWLPKKDYARVFDTARIGVTLTPELREQYMRERSEIADAE